MTTLVATPNPWNAVEPNVDWWQKKHQEQVNQLLNSTSTLLFLGDSITDHFRDIGLKTWEQYFPDALNLGISADRIQHLRWRVEHLPMGAGLQIKTMVLLIGTNNTGPERDSNVLRNTISEIIDGLESLLQLIKVKFPYLSKLLLYSILPRLDKGSEQLNQIQAINQNLSRFGDGLISVIDIGSQFMVDGQINRELLPDLLHPSERGYLVWAKSIVKNLR